MASDKKILKYPKASRINIGIVIFVVILFYMMYHLFAYLTTRHLSVYEVEYGTIAESNVYDALLLRDEDVFYSEFGGEINYYLKDASKASVKTLILSIDESGTISSMINETVAAEGKLGEEERALINDTIIDFTTSYSNETFFRVYDFKDTVASEIMEAQNLAALSAVTASGISPGGNGGFHIVTAAEDGVAVYYVDGYEDVTTETFTSEMLNELNYDKTNLKTITTVSPGSPIYKLLTNEDWNMVLPIDGDTYAAIADKSVLTVRFLADNKTVSGTVSFREEGGQHYLILSLNNSMIRYANERFTEVELILEKKTGLKIPRSAITTKEFFVVPKSYFLQGGDSSDYGLLAYTNEEGEEEPVFTPTELYYETEDSYYISEEMLPSGTKVRDPVTSEYFTLGPTGELSGVYNVNKGYAVFKQIELLYQNAEYAIIKTGTDYGISLYDHIALDGKEVSEGELVN